MSHSIDVFSNQIIYFKTCFEFIKYIKQNQGSPSAGAKAVFALRPKSKCSRHNWEGKVKKLKKLNSTDLDFFSNCGHFHCPTVFSVCLKIVIFWLSGVQGCARVQEGIPTSVIREFQLLVCVFSTFLTSRFRIRWCQTFNLSLKAILIFIFRVYIIFIIITHRHPS